MLPLVNGVIARLYEGRRRCYTQGVVVTRIAQTRARFRRLWHRFSRRGERASET